MSGPAFWDLIIAWYERSKLSVFDQFIYLWISFNAWLSMKAGSDSSDRKKVDWFKGQSDYSQSYHDLVSNNSEIQSIAQSFARTGVIDIRNQQHHSAQGPNDFEGIIDLIYLVRCNLFHGSKNRDSIIDRNIVESAYKLLDAIYGPIVSDMR